MPALHLVSHRWLGLVILCLAFLCGSVSIHGQAELRVNIVGAGSGEVTTPGILCPPDCTFSYLPSSSVSLTAIPAPGSIFRRWTNCAPNVVVAEVCTAVVSGPTAGPIPTTVVTAQFDLAGFVLTVNKTGQGGGSVVSAPPGILCGLGNCNQRFVANTSVVMTALPGIDSVFGGWTGCGLVSALTCTVTMGSDLTVTARFDFATDSININGNRQEDDVVAVLDSRRGTGCVNDEILARNSDIIDVGDVRSRGLCNSEVVVFSNDNSMEIMSTNVWTEGRGDRLVVNLDQRVELPVQVWIMVQPTAAQGPLYDSKARADMNRANQLYDDMHCGVEFKPNFNNATDDSDASGIVANNIGCGDAPQLRSQIGFTGGRLNVYYVNSLTSAARGKWCGGPGANMILISSPNADAETLSHEFGHAFTLRHTNGVLPATGLMQGGGNGRNNITEGQCFRVNVNHGSLLNNFRPISRTRRTCNDDMSSTLCLPLTLDVPN